MAVAHSPMVLKINQWLLLWYTSCSAGPEIDTKVEVVNIKENKLSYALQP
jgi:hypothetical protein